MKDEVLKICRIEGDRYFSCLKLFPAFTLEYEIGKKTEPKPRLKELGYYPLAFNKKMSIDYILNFALQNLISPCAIFRCDADIGQGEDELLRKMRKKYKLMLHRDIKFFTPLIENSMSEEEQITIFAEEDGEHYYNFPHGSIACKWIKPKELIYETPIY